MDLSAGKISAICFAGCLLLASATVSRSQAQATANNQTSNETAIATSDQNEFPPGRGKTLFLNTCSSCHSLDNVIGHNQNAAAWSDTLNRMIQYGAAGSDADFGAILDYLTTNFGPMPNKINVNKATAMNLRSWLNLTQKQAEAVVRYRKQKGDFKSLNGLEKVPGIDPKLLDAQKDRFVFG